VETKIAEMVVAEFVTVHFVHCPLSTLVKKLLTRYASDDLASDDVSSGALLQTRFFICTSSDAFLQMHSSRCFLTSNKIPLLLNLFNQNLFE